MCKDLICRQKKILLCSILCIPSVTKSIIYNIYYFIYYNIQLLMTNILLKTMRHQQQQMVQQCGITYDNTQCRLAPLALQTVYSMVQYIYCKFSLNLKWMRHFSLKLRKKTQTFWQGSCPPRRGLKPPLRIQLRTL